MKDSKKKETATARAGFTLVELVVVIAILGILAGVAYPAYTGYIKRAQDAKVMSQLSTVVVTVQSAMAASSDTKPLKEITIELKNTGEGTVSAEHDDESPVIYTPTTLLKDLGAPVFTDDAAITLTDISKSSYSNGGTLTWTADNETWSFVPTP